MAYTVQQWLNNVISPPYGPINDTRLSYIEAGIRDAHITADAALPKDVVVAAGTRVFSSKKASGDANATVRLLGSGQMEWGAGGVSALDVFLRRSGAATLEVAGSLGVTGNLNVTGTVTGQGLVPSGTIAFTLAAAAPSGWLLLDGTTITNGQTLYPGLWAVLPASMKSGANIVLPNAKGKAVVGFDGAQGEFDVMGEIGGSKSVALTLAELAHDHSMQGHTHVGAAHTHPFSLSTTLGGGGDVSAAGTAANIYSASASGSGTTGAASATTTGGPSVANTGAVQNVGASAHTNLQPYIVFNVMVKT